MGGNKPAFLVRKIHPALGRSDGRSKPRTSGPVPLSMPKCHLPAIAVKYPAL
jgi:hypothetical protein